MSTLADSRQKRARPNLIPKGMLPTTLVASRTGIAATTLRRWARGEIVKARKLGPKNWYIDLADARRIARIIKPGPKPQQ